MTNTTHYNLKKPDITDQVKLSDLNENADAIDAALHSLQQGIDGGTQTAQTNLTSHVNNKNNPHMVTAAQVGADLAGSANAVQANLNAHIGNTNNPHGVTVGQIGAAAAYHTHDASQIVSGILPPTLGGTGVNSIAALVSQLAANGGCRITYGSYVGTGNNTASLTFLFQPYLVIIQGLEAPGNFGAYLLLVQGASVVLQASDTAYNRIHASWTSKGVTWTCDNDDALQNQSGQTYYYVAFGV